MSSKGAFLLSRGTFESEIWLKPSWWFKVWVYILGNVKHEDNGICKRGQNFFTAEQIFIDCKLRHEGLKQKSIHNAIAWLVERQMLSTEKTTRGMFISVLNYAKYQNISTYEKESKKDRSRTDQGQVKETITKEGKNERMKEVITNVIISEPKQNSFEEAEIMFERMRVYLETNNSTEKDKEMIRFYEYWTAPVKSGKELWRTEKTFAFKLRISNWMDKKNFKTESFTKKSGTAYC